MMTNRESQQVLERQDSLHLRARLQQMVEKDLLGPAAGLEEELINSPIDRYLLGKLAPKNELTPVDEQEELAVDGIDELEEGPIEAKPTAIASMFPSSIGMTFSLKKEAGSFQLCVRWGHYERVQSDFLTKEDGSPRRVWKRQQIDATSEPFPLVPGKIGPWSPSSQFEDIVVKGLVRDKGDAWTISLYLINSTERPKTNIAEAWVFQPELIVFHPENLPVFVKRRLPDNFRIENPEDRQMEMNYRRHLEFVIGHGISAHATLNDNDWQHAVKVETKVIPSQEVLRMEAPDPVQTPGMDGLVLDMKVLANLDRGAFTNALMPLVESYELWINALEEHQEVDLLPYHQDAKAALFKCRQNHDRIKSGIQLLDTDEDAAKAFKFANQTMADQRVRSIFSRSARQGNSPRIEDIDIPSNRSWRPFQLAFLLLTLPEMVDPAHPHRSDPEQNLVDLLWFPTGGGKTEAYLGLTAYTMAIRRLQKSPQWPNGQAGVSVLMRYTLRLLTLQQFQRAASLMCACELIRQKDPATWGDEPFRIGLWVGEKSAPNSTVDAQKEIEQTRLPNAARYFGGKGTVAQLTNCPWCGKTINPGKDIKVEPYNSGRGRTLQYCSDPLGECPFSRRQSPNEGLPIVVVDEEIYRLLPSLIIATVDKFAQMPWKGETQMLFGRVNGKCPRHGFRSPDLEDAGSHPKVGGLPAVRTTPMQPLRPPDLIIQDELHLISGPLGTLVGLYETAVDYLCEWNAGEKRIKPKVIASSATIRRAQDQVRGLYTRRLNVFPPSGINTEDNFFSRQVPSSEKVPGRSYIGISAAGTTIKTALLRVYFAYMAAAQTLFEEYGDLADPWMTTIGYFNAMRELGGMRRIVDDTLRTILRNAPDHGLARRYISEGSVEELNSRRSGSDIPRILDRLETRFEPKVITGSENSVTTKDKDKQYPLDIVLCTNMISVGVDIDRLGLMIVAGQPKTTAEYIQASSRVGRRFPGIVCTIYNWSRPRDLSHYERFEHYHDTFYEHVEALSVTPCAPRALDRGLTGAMVSMLRLEGDRLNGDDAAQNFQTTDPSLLLVMDSIQDRVSRITMDNRATGLVKDMLNERIDHWSSQTRRLASELTYKTRKGNKVPLLSQPQDSKRHLFTCLNSLRDVEKSINLILYQKDASDREGE